MNDATINNHEFNNDFGGPPVLEQDTIVGSQDSDGLSNGSNTKNEKLRAFASMTGNVLEWYDFAVFGFFSDILGRVFFPPQSGNAAIIESFAVFGGAFMMRPVGGLMMGYIGDVYGRKKALELSMFLMAVPTFLLGCLPSYESVGMISIIMLILVRMLQGLSVGGQLVSSLVFLVEGKPKSKWGLYGSFSLVAANFGTLLGGLVAALIRKSLDETALTLWGWRIPFLSGVVVSVSGLYLRYYCDDNDFHRRQKTSAEFIENPIKHAFSRANRRALLSATLVPMLWSSGFYLTFVWMAIYMETLIDPPVENAFALNSASLFFSLCLCFPVAGLLSDIHGRRRIMMTGGIGLAILSPFMLRIISEGKLLGVFIAQSLMGVSLSCWGSPMCAWLVESFPPAIRLTSVAIGYNIAQACIGGSSPALATYLVDKYGKYSPGYVLSAVSVLSLGGLLLAPKFRNLQHSSSSTEYDGINLSSVHESSQFEDNEGTWT